MQDSKRSRLLSIRQLFFWLHLLAGVIAGLVILNLTVTGALLAFRGQIVSVWERQALPPIPVRVAEFGVGPEEIARAAYAHCGRMPTSVQYGCDGEPVLATMSRSHVLYLDPYTARVLSDGSPELRAFFGKVLVWHRFLGLSGRSRAWGKATTGACTLLFLSLCLTGFVVWVPRRWDRVGLRWSLVPVFAGRLKGWCSSWHNVIGFWLLLPTVAILFTGACISYSGLGNWVTRLAGDGSAEVVAQLGQERGNRDASPSDASTRRSAGDSDAVERESHVSAVLPPDQEQRLWGLNALTLRARNSLPYQRSLTVTIPPTAAAPVVFVRDDGTGSQPQYRSTLVLSRQGGVMSWTSFAEEKAVKRVRSVIRTVHTGEYLGTFGQVVAFLVCIGGVLLVTTGYVNCYWRCREWLIRGRRRQEQELQNPPGSALQNQPGDELQNHQEQEPQNHPGDELQNHQEQEPQNHPGDEPQNRQEQEPQNHPGDELQNRQEHEPQNHPEDELQNSPGDEVAQHRGPE